MQPFRRPYYFDPVVIALALVVAGIFALLRACGG